MSPKNEIKQAGENRVTYLSLLLNDPTIIEITEPYIQVSGSLAAYFPKEELVLLRQTIAIHASSARTMNTEIKYGDTVRVMLDENGTARIVGIPRFWKNIDGLHHLMKRMGYTIRAKKPNASISRRIPQTRNP